MATGIQSSLRAVSEVDKTVVRTLLRESSPRTLSFLQEAVGRITQLGTRQLVESMIAQGSLRYIDDKKISVELLK